MVAGRIGARTASRSLAITIARIIPTCSEQPPTTPCRVLPKERDHYTENWCRSVLMNHTGKGFDEDQLVGRTLRVGAKATIAVVERDPRCKMITLEPGYCGTGYPDHETIGSRPRNQGWRLRRGSNRRHGSAGRRDLPATLTQTPNRKIIAIHSCRKERSPDDRRCLVKTSGTRK